MKLYIKQKFFALTDTFDIFDEYGNPVYRVEAEFLTLLHHLNVYDYNNEKVGAVHQRFSFLLPKFDIEVNNAIVGTIQKEFTLFDHQYDIDFNGWHCEGNFLGWDYDIYDRDDNLIAHISKELFHLTDHYVLDIQNQEDEIYVLMLAIAIDAEKCSSNASASVHNN